MKEYLARLEPDRRKMVEAVRMAVRKGLDKGYKEGILYGMIGWFVTHSIFPAGYHCLGIASPRHRLSNPSASVGTSYPV